LRHLIALCCCLFGLLSFSVHAAESSPQDSLLTELVGAKLKNMTPILEKLANTQGEAILPLFRTLLGGDLYYIKADKSLVGQFDEQGNTVYKDVFSQVVVPNLSKKDVKKIRVNNTLRGYLRNAIAQIQLTAKSPELRQSAV